MILLVNREALQLNGRLVTNSQTMPLVNPRGGWTRSEKAHGSKNRPIRNAEIEINNQHKIYTLSRCYPRQPRFYLFCIIF